MNDKDELNKCKLEVKRLEAELEKYKNAHEYLNGYWDSFSSEQQRQINKDLNKIFGKGNKEYLDEVENFDGICDDCKFSIINDDGIPPNV